MSILQRIKNAINAVSRIFNKKPLGIEGPEAHIPTKGPEAYIAPKGPDYDRVGDEEYQVGDRVFKGETRAFIESVRVPEAELKREAVSFRGLEPDISDNLVKEGIRKIGGKPNLTHKEQPTLSGTLDGRNFVSIKRLNVKEGDVGQTICAENGYYDITTSKDDLQRGTYRESLTNEDGVNTFFSTRLGKDNSYVNSVKSKSGITLTESANFATMDGDSVEFEQFAQPSEEYLEEYSKATGLPIIMNSHKAPRYDGLDIISLNDAVRGKDSKATFPYIVSIEASKGVEGAKKAVKYAYATKEAYINGERPYMVYLNGIDGREGPSGMFRLTEDGTYIDNSTFRGDLSSGKYSYDTVSLEDIKALAGKFPTDLSERAKSAITGQFRIPEAVEQIYEKATSIENEKESPDKGIEISE